jgi:hypothetical protein
MNWTGAYDSRFLAGDWTGLLEEHDRWVHDYNVQEHYAHRHPIEVARDPFRALR